MEQLLYLEEHISCLRYKPNVELGFKFLNINQGYSFERKNKDYHHILFLLEGELSINCNDDIEKIVNPKNFFLIPKSADFLCRASQPSSLLIFSFDSLVTICEKMHLQSYSRLCEGKQYSFHTLEMHSSLGMFIDLLKMYLGNSMNCMHLHTIKHQELFLILRGYYSKEELAAFFHPIIGKHYDFRNLILENYLKVNSLEELVQISGMGRTSFSNKFKEEFGIPAHQWLLKQKAKHIKYKLAEPGVTLSDIMMKFNFSSATQLTRFCKQQFGCTPSELKKQLENIV